MTVDVARAEGDGLLVEFEGRTYAFCRAGCRSAFEEEPATYAAQADAAPPVVTPSPGGLSVIDEGMRRWYKSCSDCLSDAFADIKAALDAARAAASEPPVHAGICEVAESQEAATPVR